MNKLLGYLSSLVMVVTPLVAGCAAESEREESASAGDALSTGRLANEYDGTIKDLPIMARFEVTSTGGTNVVTGSYFYRGQVTKGESIALKGKLEEAHLVLDETVLGVKTGSFDGMLRDGHIEGTWSKPDGSRRYAFRMDAIFAGYPFTVERKVSDNAPALESSGVQKTCDLEATYLEVFGLTDAGVTSAINAELAVHPIEKNPDGKCEYAESDYSTQSVKFLGKNVLVVQTVGSWFGGGAHPINGMQWKNLSLTTGKVYGSQDIFKADAKEALHTMLVKGIGARADLDKDLGGYLLEEANFAFEQKDVLSTLDYFATADGIRVSLFNWLPHAMQALDMDGTLLPWRDVKPLLAPGTEIEALSPAPVK